LENRVFLTGSAGHGSRVRVVLGYGPSWVNGSSPEITSQAAGSSLVQWVVRVSHKRVTGSRTAQVLSLGSGGLRVTGLPKIGSPCSLCRVSSSRIHRILPSHSLSISQSPSISHSMSLFPSQSLDLSLSVSSLCLYLTLCSQLPLNHSISLSRVSLCDR
jgi:hypothetical protein